MGASANDAALYASLKVRAERLGVLGWGLQAATALMYSASLFGGRTARRVFVSLGVLIAADGVVLLLIAVMIRLIFM
jgi:hypothetical protein